MRDIKETKCPHCGKEIVVVTSSDWVNGEPFTYVIKGKDDK